MTEKTISSSLRRTAAALARITAAGSLAGLAVAAFAAPVQAGENRDWGIAPDALCSVAPDDKIWSEDDKIWSVTTNDGNGCVTGVDLSVRPAGDGASGFHPPYSVRITGVAPENRDW